VRGRFLYWIALLLITVVAGIFLPRIWCGEFCKWAFRILGSVFVIYGAVLNFVAGKTLKKYGHKKPLGKFSPPDKLVTKGIYSKMRHPAQFGNLFILLGISLLFAKITVLMFVGWILFFGLAFIVWIEEPEAVEKFEEYPSYMAKTKPFLPLNPFNYLKEL